MAKETVKKAPGKPKRSAPAPEVDPSFAPLVAAFAGDRQVSYRKLMASFGLRVKGKIFAMLVRGKLVAKLPKARVDELVGSGTGTRFDPGHGRLMNEWISIPPGAVDWLAIAREAHRFVRTGKR